MQRVSGVIPLQSNIPKILRGVIGGALKHMIIGATTLGWFVSNLHTYLEPRISSLVSHAWQ